jgi:hypothetical protein
MSGINFLSFSKMINSLNLPIASLMVMMSFWPMYGQAEQLHTYMAYYQQQGLNLIAGGLLYPLSKDHDVMECYAEQWLGNSKTMFIVDGIRVKAKPTDDKKMNDQNSANEADDETKDLTNEQERENLLKEEKEFLNRIRKLIEKSFKS